jgi:Na+/melibiose symporter-like transporter
MRSSISSHDSYAKSEDKINLDDREYKDALTKSQVFAYAVGHLMNDLVIQVWNSYQSWYLIKTVAMTEHQTGKIALVGQIIDAAA